MLNNFFLKIVMFTR